MPKRFIYLSRKQPGRAIIAMVAAVTMAMTAFTLTPLYGPPEVYKWGFTDHPGIADNIPNVILVFILTLYALWTVKTNSLKHMARGALAMHFVWMLSALSRAVVSQYPFQLLWVPFLIVALVMGIIYLHMSKEHHLTSRLDA